MKRLRVVVTWIAVAMISVASSELMLRAQQWLGPIYDLDRQDGSLEWVSDTVNHRPPTRETYTLVGKEKYGAYAGTEVTYEYDALGIRKPRSHRTADNCSRTETILFMGDSFIEGYDIPNTISDRVATILADRFGICATVLNAGYSSYSPAIFIPLAKQILASVPVDYVVVDVDETDLVDDALRYEQLITRDAEGRNVGVRASPLNVDVNRRLVAIRTRPLYLQRLAEKLYLRFVLMPQITAQALDPFKFSRDRSADVAQSRRRELSIFERNLAELVNFLASSLVSKRRIVFIRHPHLQHLATASGPPEWNSLVASTVRRTVTDIGASYFDATPDLQRRFGADPSMYYWKDDMHLNFQGLEVYSELVAAYLAQQIRKRE